MPDFDQYWKNLIVPVLQQCPLGGTALWPDTALLLAAVDEGIPSHSPPWGSASLLRQCCQEACWHGGRWGDHFGEITWAKGQPEMPKRQIKSKSENVLLLFVSPERQKFSGGNWSCL